MLCAVPDEYSGSLWASCAAGRKQNQAELCKMDISLFGFICLSWAMLTYLDVFQQAMLQWSFYWKVSFGTSQGDVKQLWPVLDLTQEAKLWIQNVQTSLQQTLLSGASALK